MTDLNKMDKTASQPKKDGPIRNKFGDIVERVGERMSENAKNPAPDRYGNVDRNAGQKVGHPDSERKH